jgi:hypothetical protein
MSISSLDQTPAFIGEYVHEHNICGGDLIARDPSLISRRPQLPEGFFISLQELRKGVGYEQED